MYALLLDLAGHEEQLAELTVKAKKLSEVKVTMTAMAQLRIATVKGGPAATVYVDGRPRGVPPIEVNALSAGEHEVIVMAPGHRETRLNVPLAPGQVADLIVGLVPADAAVTLSPPTGLLIESVPTHAAVKVDGQIRGFTPLALDGLQPGPRSIEVFLPWHNGSVRDVDVVDKAVVRYLAALTSVPFTVAPQSDGKPRREVGRMAAGAREGPWLSLSDRGRRVAETHYERGALHGRYATWFDAQGSPRRWAGAFHRGEPHGPWLQWSEEGKVLATGWYDHGELRHGHKVEGAVSLAYLLKKPECPKGSYAASGVNVKPDGLHAAGAVKTLRRWCEKSPGKSHGPRHDRSSVGTFWCATDYVEGLAHGLSVCWNDDGVKRSERRLVRGRIAR
jgi:hypothetical protein